MLVTRTWTFSDDFHTAAGFPWPGAARGSLSARLAHLSLAVVWTILRCYSVLMFLVILCQFPFVPNPAIIKNDLEGCNEYHARWTEGSGRRERERERKRKGHGAEKKETLGGVVS